MTQADLIRLLLKIFLVTGFVTLAGWIALYSLLAPWWRNPIGRTLVAKTALIAGTFLVVTLGAFFPWFDKHPLITGWIDVALIGGVTPVMAWRSVVWVRLYRAGRLPRNGNDG